MHVELKSPELDGIIARLATLEERMAGMQAKKRYYDIKEAAVYLNVCSKQVRRYLTRGLLQRSLAGRKIQIPAESLEDFRKLTVS